MVCRGQQFSLTSLRRWLIQALKWDLNQLWNFLQGSKWCTFGSVCFGEMGQCCCCAREKGQGLRCSKPFPQAARAGTRNIPRGDATPAPPHPEGEDKNPQSNPNPYGHPGATGEQQEWFLSPCSLSIAFGHTQDPSAWQIVLPPRTTCSPLSPGISLLCKGQVKALIYVRLQPLLHSVRGFLFCVLELVFVSCAWDEQEGAEVQRSIKDWRSSVTHWQQGLGIWLLQNLKSLELNN